MDKLKAKIPGTSAYKAKKAETGGGKAGDTGGPSTSTNTTGTGIGTSEATGTGTHLQPATSTHGAQNTSETLQPGVGGVDQKTMETEELQPHVSKNMDSKQREEMELQPDSQRQPVGVNRETLELQPDQTQHRTPQNELQPPTGH